MKAKRVLMRGFLMAAGVAGTWGLILYAVGPTMIGAALAAGSAALIRLAVFHASAKA